MPSGPFTTLSRLACTAAAVVLLFVAGPARAVDPEYAGSERCAKCHSDEHATWKKSYHSKMVRPKEEAILKDVVEQWASGGPTKINLTGAPATLADVVYVVGSKWKQRFLVKDAASGAHLFLDKQWNGTSKKWENYGQKNDWETNCATCHATGYRLTSYDARNPAAQKWSYSEMNIGCEACHGPGAAHADAKGKKPIYTFTGKSVQEQSRVCGYCHIRLDNEQYKTAQGKPSEHLPHPQIGKTRLPGDDWTKWYPEHVVIPGVQPEDKIDAAYEGDLKGMFKLDDLSKASGIFEAGKHHQQYQEFLQSKHYRTKAGTGPLSCQTCHSSHATDVKPRMIVAKETCKQCHDASYTVEKYMPGTGGTAAGLFVRTHTFNKNPRPPQTTVTTEPIYNR